MRGASGGSLTVTVPSSLVEAIVDRGDEGTYDAVLRLPDETVVNGLDVSGHYVPVTVGARWVQETPEGLMCGSSTSHVGIDAAEPVFPFRFEGGRRRTADGLGEGGIPPRALARVLAAQMPRGPRSRPRPPRPPRSVTIDPRRVDPARVGTDLGRGGGFRADVSLDGVNVGGRSLTGFTLTASIARGGEDPTSPIEVRTDSEDVTVWRRLGDGTFEVPEPKLSPTEMDGLYEQVASKSPRHLRPLPRPMAMDRERREGLAPVGRQHDVAKVPAPVTPQVPPEEGDAGGDEGVPLDDLIAEVMF